MAYYGYDQDYRSQQGPSGIVEWIIAIIMLPFALLFGTFKWAAQWAIILLVIGIPLSLVIGAFNALTGS